MSEMYRLYYTEALIQGKEDSRMEGTLDFDSLDIGANF